MRDKYVTRKDGIFMYKFVYISSCYPIWKSADYVIKNVQSISGTSFYIIDVRSFLVWGDSNHRCGARAPSRPAQHTPLSCDTRYSWHSG